LRKKYVQGNEKKKPRTTIRIGPRTPRRPAEKKEGEKASSSKKGRGKEGGTLETERTKEKKRHPKPGDQHPGPSKQRLIREEGRKEKKKGRRGSDSSDQGEKEQKREES